MRDSITVLKHPVNTLAKTWRADGSVKAYDNAKFFQVEQRALNNSRDLSTLLTELEQNPSCLRDSRAYVGDAEASTLDTEFQKGKDGASPSCTSISRITGCLLRSTTSTHCAAIRWPIR
ncbi:hypothetical protein [Xylella fastidiosa]|uniref:hypothetical protein n=1 Tax=Xylella fastidiosa TaxID=2371 RepID=UPI00398488B9